MNHEDGPSAPAEGREKPQQLFPWEILLVEQLHSAGSLFASDNFGPGFHPFAQHIATHVAWRNPYARIISYAFHFSRDTDGVHVQFRITRIEVHRRIRRKPYRRLYAIAAHLERFEVQVLVPVKLRKSHRIAHATWMCGRLHGSQTQRAGHLPACPLECGNATAGFQSVTRHNLCAAENETFGPYFVRTYVASSVKASFCSLRNVQVVLK